MKNNEIEQGESFDDNEQNVHPFMSIANACTAIENLEHFIKLENGKEFHNAADSLVHIKRILYKRIDNGHKHQNCSYKLL